MTNFRKKTKAEDIGSNDPDYEPDKVISPDPIISTITATAIPNIQGITFTEIQTSALEASPASDVVTPLQIGVTP